MKCSDKGKRGLKMDIDVDYFNSSTCQKRSKGQPELYHIKIH